jgi:tRNA U34 5-methylaminomethyl-2-thiouridine-forming methyltransferase MnmC
MAVKNQSEQVAWRDEGTPVSTLFDDPYFSLHDGLAETRHVFLAGNGLPARFRGGFRVAELGFGTGLNLLATWAAWRAAGTPGRLHFTSFEAYPMPVGDMARALGAFPELADLREPLLDHWGQGLRRFDLGATTVEILVGDANERLAAWDGQADAWYLDGFSPAKNPALWGAALMADVARHTAPGGTFATYTAAGFVRRGLQAAGFQVERISGYGHKRHMSCGVFAGVPKGIVG